MWGKYISALSQIEINIVIVYLRKEFMEFLISKFFLGLINFLKSKGKSP